MAETVSGRDLRLRGVFSGHPRSFAMTGRVIRQGKSSQEISPEAGAVDLYRQVKACVVPNASNVGSANCYDPLLFCRFRYASSQTPGKDKRYHFHGTVRS